MSVSFKEIFAYDSGLDLKILWEGIIMQKYEKIGNEIIKGVGTIDNIESVSHCYTRLRLRIKNSSKIDKEYLNNIDGVVQVLVSGGQLQIVMPQDLDKVYNYVYNKHNVNGDTSEIATNEKNENQKNILKSTIEQILNAISNSLTPVIGGLAMTGLFLALLNLLTVTNVINAESQTYQILEMMGDSLFHFMPFLVAYGASRFFKTNTILSLLLAGILMHPTLIELVESGQDIHMFGIPIPSLNYGATLIPILITVWTQSLLEKFFDRPFLNKLGLLKMFPVFLVMAPLTLIVTAPIGGYVTSFIAEGAIWVYEQVSVLGVTLLSLLMPLFIATGSHWVFFPVAFSNISNLGYDPFLWLAFTAWNFSQLGMSLAVFFKAKKRSVKTFAGTAAFSIGASGITEPAVYGLMLKMKKPIIPSIIASGVGGLYFSFFDVKVYELVTVSFLSLPQFISPSGGNNFILALVGIIIVTAISFFLTWIFGVDETMFEEDSASARAMD